MGGTPSPINLDGQNGTARIELEDGSLFVSGVVEPYTRPISIWSGRRGTFIDGWEMAGTLNLLGFGGSGGPAMLYGSTVLSGTANVFGPEGAEIENLTTTPSASLTVDVDEPTLTLLGNTEWDGGTITGAGQIYQDSDAMVVGNTTIGVANYSFGNMNDHNRLRWTTAGPKCRCDTCVRRNNDPGRRNLGTQH